MNNQPSLEEWKKKKCYCRCHCGKYRFYDEHSHCLKCSSKILSYRLSQAKAQGAEEEKARIRQLIVDNDESYISEEVRQARNRMKASLIDLLTPQKEEKV